MKVQKEAKKIIKLFKNSCLDIFIYQKNKCVNSVFETDNNLTALRDLSIQE